MNETRQKIWRGDPAGRIEVEIEAYGMLMSPTYSDANAEYAKGNKIAAVKLLRRAVTFVDIVDRNFAALGKSLADIPVNTLDVMGSIKLKAPRLLGGNLDRATDYYMMAANQLHPDWQNNRLRPHQKSLAEVGLAECLLAKGDWQGALDFARRAVMRRDKFTREADQDLAMNQTIRILRRAGIVMCKAGDDRDKDKARLYFADARAIIANLGEAGENQARKFVADLKSAGIEL